MYTKWTGIDEDKLVELYKKLDDDDIDMSDTQLGRAKAENKALLISQAIEMTEEDLERLYGNLNDSQRESLGSLVSGKSVPVDDVGVGGTMDELDDFLEQNVSQENENPLDLQETQL